MFCYLQNFSEKVVIESEKLLSEPKGTWAFRANLEVEGFRLLKRGESKI